MKKTLIIISACVGLIFSIQAFTIKPQSQWKNLQILPQDISENKLDSIMDHFTVSLGVKCNYCHARNTTTNKLDFPSDAKPEKLVARKMMLMAIDINKNHFNEMEEGETVTDTTSAGYLLQQVTCFTCHQGSTHPKNHPPKKKD